VHVLGFVGAKSQPLFQELAAERMLTDFTIVVGETRTNLTLFNPQQAQETHIRTQGFSITATDYESLMTKLASCLQQDDIVVFSGSLPKGAPPDLYASLVNVCHAKLAMAFLDSSGESLQLGLTAKPFLIKPNQEEFAALLGRTIHDEQEMIAAAREIIATGVKWVVISRAKQGALMISDEIAVVASVVNLDEQEIMSHVGCGDALVAGLAVAQQQKLELLERVKLAVACGTANLFSLEPGKIDTEKLLQIFVQVQVRFL
jgi:1-phosphofructokinase family hexose kinase